MKPETILAILGPLAEVASAREGERLIGGKGFTILDGYKLRCAGLVGRNPELDDPEIAALNPEPEVLIQHTIGTFRISDAAKAAGTRAFAIGNTEPVRGKDEKPDAFALRVAQHDLENGGEFIFELNMELDLTNPVCRVCGQPVVL